MTGSSSAAKWTTLAYHRKWLIDQASALFAFFERRSINPQGGFFALDDRGEPIAGETASLREIHATTRMVHCFAIARLLGRPGADEFIDHGMAYLWDGHRDDTHGGHFWAVRDGDPHNDQKLAYGHAFVLLAGASAKIVGHPNADRLIADVTDVITSRFWEKKHGACAEEFARDWQSISRYRGQNSNMHMTEACMAAFEATGDDTYLDMAESIATLLIRKLTPAAGGRVPEHFNENWELDPEYAGGAVFRPFGTTPGHWLEWTRLCLQLWELGGRRREWLLPAAKDLFALAVKEGWNHEKGGFHYTLDWDGKPHLRNRLWWPCAEGIGAAAFLNAIDGAAEYEEWYRRIWDFTASRLIDRDDGGWRTEAVDADVTPLFSGKPDLYHALQACLIPLLPTSGSVTRGLVTTGLRLEAG